MSVDSELQRHQHDWKGFIRLLNISTAGIVAILVLMALFLT